jgi:hypothetical protein
MLLSFAAIEHGTSRCGWFQAKWEVAHRSNSYRSGAYNHPDSEEARGGWEICGVLWYLKETWNLVSSSIGCITLELFGYLPEYFYLVAVKLTPSINDRSWDVLIVFG